MQTIDIEAARIDLARLVDQAVKGHSFIITREGRPLVKVSLVEGEDICGLLDPASELPNPDDGHQASQRPPDVDIT